MLRAMSGKSPAAALASDRASLAEAGHAVWIDLVEPTEHERSEIAHLTGLCVPDRSAVAEIETSSRLVSENGVLTLSTPMVSRAADGTLAVAPLGFVVSRDRLLTLRYAGSTVFDAFAEHWRAASQTEPICGMEPFLGILEALVDRLADVLEQVGAELDIVFRRRLPQRQRQRPVAPAGCVPAGYAGRYRPEGRARFAFARRAARCGPDRTLRF